MARSKPIRWLLIAAVVIVALLAIGTTIRRRAERKRQASYQSVLRQYSTKLKPGMQRGEVEAFLASQGRAFEQTCCLSSVKLGSSALEDIVKIGSGPKLPRTPGIRKLFWARSLSALSEARFLRSGRRTQVDLARFR